MNAAAFRWDQPARAMLSEALARVGPSRCVVETRPGDLVLLEVPFGKGHDRNGTGGLLECGAALSTAWTVLRVLGQEPITSFPDDPDRPDEVAVVRLAGVRHPGSGEWARYAALRTIEDVREGLKPVSAAMLGALAADNFWPDTTVRLVRPEWVPGLRGLGADLTGQSALLILTPEDTRRHHVLVGAALHGIRLSAVVRGLVTQVAALPVLASAERARLLAAAGLPGVLQAVVRVGVPQPKRKKT